MTRKIIGREIIRPGLGLATLSGILARAELDAGQERFLALFDGCFGGDICDLGRIGEVVEGVNSNTSFAAKLFLATAKKVAFRIVSGGMRADRF